MSGAMIAASGLDKTFVLHLQAGARLDVLRGAGLRVHAGECVALSGPSGAGKTTLLRALYGNYLVDRGEILVRHRGATVDLVTASPETIIDIRRVTLGYVSQFLRAMPRVAAIDVVAGTALDRGIDGDTAHAQAAAVLTRLGIGPRLHRLPPATFSGGEQQRVNLARSFVCAWPVLLLDEPTASLDAANRDIVVDLINAAKRSGSAVVGIFHDGDVRDRVADRVFHIEPVTAAEPA
ncbi:phosphonate C-P lyase system protein PhnL [Acidiphilium sp.]|uniref:phosphonate C-P lyase system protein PhnL n=1 Tax=Acidiphilium sp. TaxID=527 RepID=UPI003CFCC32A